jgi:SNF2 family DNA or RNA helicase
MIEKNGVLIASVSKPSVITSLIPHAKHIRFKGKDLVLIKHGLDEAQVLTNLGLNPPSPIRTKYTFTGRFNPFPHQIDTAEFATLHRRCFILNEMRTGKTSACLWGGDYLINNGYIDEIIVVCPISVMEVWMREAFSTLPHRSASVIVGTKLKKLAVLNSQSFIKIINFDGVVSIQDELAKYIGSHKRILLIVDECATYRSAGIKRYKALKKIITPHVWLWMLTGTPTPNAPTDAWAQVKLVSPNNVPASFKLFQETVMRPAGPYKWIPRPGAEQIVFQAMQPAIRFLRKDVMKSVPPITEDVKCSLTPEQVVAYENFKKKMRHEDKAAGVDITAANAAVRMVKLQQVFCGVVKDDDGNAVYLDNTPRLEQTEELIERAGGKAIVYCTFKLSQSQLLTYLSKRWRCAVVNGDVPKAQRDAIFAAFQRNEIDVLIAHPQTCGHGLDLTAASTIIWFSPTYSNEFYEQANARIEGPNQTENCGIYHIGSHPVEWYIYGVVAKKGNMQGALLNLYNKIMALPLAA